MTRETWPLLQELSAHLEDSSTLTDGFFYAAAARLAESIVDRDPKTIADLSSGLRTLFEQLAKKTPADLVGVLSTPHKSPSIHHAFSMGQLAFAQQLAGYVSSRRASSQFVEAIHDVKLRQYVSALAKADLSGTQLSTLVKERVETVSRKLADLRRIGITDFRREGVHIINFLTPAAKAVFDAEQTDYESHRAHETDARLSWIEQQRGLLPEHLRSAVTFDSHRRMPC
jgi:DNA-binding transcriptional ArsR family regulator